MTIIVAKIERYFDTDSIKYDFPDFDWTEEGYLEYAKETLYEDILQEYKAQDLFEMIEVEVLPSAFDK